MLPIVLILLFVIALAVVFGRAAAQLFIALVVMAVGLFVLVSMLPLIPGVLETCRLWWTGADWAEIGFVSVMPLIVVMAFVALAFVKRPVKKAVGEGDGAVAEWEEQLRMVRAAAERKQLSRELPAQPTTTTVPRERGEPCRFLDVQPTTATVPKFGFTRDPPESQ